MTSTHRSLAFVIHGIGDRPKASTLKSVAENFLPLIRRRLDSKAVVKASPLDDSGPADVVFHFEPNGTADSYEARFVEVWWAKSFSAPGLGALLMGGAVAFWRRWIRQGTKAKWYTYVARLLGEAISTVVFNLLATAVALVLVPLAIALSIYAALPRKPLWTSLMAGWHAGLLARVGKIQTMVVETGVIVLLPVFAVVLLLLWLIESVVPKAALTSPLKEVHLRLVNILTNQFGDMWCYLYQAWEASRITSRFEDEFAREVTLAFQSGSEIESVLVIGHSMGTVVAYEALTGDKLRPIIQSHFGPQSQTTLTFVSVGSALNLAWDTAPANESFRFAKALPPEVAWLNIWSEYDPVAGEPLRVPADALGSRAAITPESEGLSVPLQQRGVVNQMDLFSDHSAYWNNAEEVLAPILDRLMNRALTARLRMKVPERRIRVRVLAGFKALAWLLGLGAYFAAGLFPRQLDRAGDRIVDQLRRLVPNDLAKAVDSAWETLTGVVDESLVEALLVTVIVMVAYSTAVKWAWDLWDQRKKYDEPGPARVATGQTVPRAASAGGGLTSAADG